MKDFCILKAGLVVRDQRLHAAIGSRPRPPARAAELIPA
jgi:hypothetical protein